MPSVPSATFARSRGTRRTRCSTRSASAPASRVAVHDREHQGHHAGGVSDVRGRRRLGNRVAGQELDERDRDVQPGAAGARLAGDHVPPADPGRGQGHHAGQGRGDVRQGARRPSCSPRPRSSSTRASRCGPPARRRSSAAKAVGAATVARRVRRTCRRPTRRRTTRSRCRRRPIRPSSTACPATATRCTPTRRSPRWAASTGRSCTACARTASPASAAGRPVRQRRHQVPPHRGPVLVTRHARRCLTIRAWRTADGEAVFTTSVGDRTVIDQGLVKFG